MQSCILVINKGVNETRQLASYSDSTRLKLVQNSTRVNSTRALARLEMLTSRVEQLVTRLEKLARNSNIFVYKILKVFFLNFISLL